MLSVIADACGVIERQTGQQPNLSSLRFDDRRVYDMICHGETVGVFQVESRAQQDLIPRFQLRTFADLTVEVASRASVNIVVILPPPPTRARRGIDPKRKAVVKFMRDFSD
jgi:error-prone DNA polymerase